MSSIDEIKTAKRQLTIRTGVVKRLGNEWKSYQAETAQQQTVVDRLEAKEGTDEWDLQNSRKVLSDCKQMIEPSRKRALEALQQLQDIISMSSSEPELAESEEYKTATSVLETQTAALSSN